MSAKEQTDTPTPKEASEIAKRFIDRHFGNKGELPRISIPARPDHDDDIRLLSFIEQAEKDQTKLTAIQADVRRLVREVQENVNRFEKARWGHDSDIASVESINSIQDFIDQFIANNPSLKPENEQAD